MTVPDPLALAADLLNAESVDASGFAHLANEHASCAADWRLYCPESWDDKALDDPVQAARARDLVAA